MERLYVFSIYFVGILALSCSNNVLSPISFDTSYTGADSSSDTGSDNDSDTCTSAACYAPTDTETSTDADADADTDTDTDTDTDADTDTDTDTDADTDSDVDTGEDTYSYSADAVMDAIGFATVAAIDVSELTGGNGGAEVTVGTSDEMQTAINDKGDPPLTIYVDGTLSTTTDLDRIRIQDVRDLSIIGVGTNGILNGIGLHIRDSANIVVRNLTIHHVVDGTGDGISVENTHHFWIDHCDIYNDRDGVTSYDGLLDISNGCDYATISWNYLHDNPKGLIVGNSDNNAETDADANHVTYHHNLITNVSPGGLSFRFGQSHTFNNFINFTETGSCIGVSSRMGACVRVELNLFAGISEPLKTNQSGDTLETLGALDVMLNGFGTYSQITLTPTCAFVAPYNYLHTVNATQDLPSLLAANAGAGKI